MFSFVTAVDKGSRARKLKHDVIEAVNELIQDIATCYEQIAEQAVEHIHQKFVSPETTLRYIVILLLFYGAYCLKTCCVCSPTCEFIIFTYLCVNLFEPTICPESFFLFSRKC